MHTQGGPAHLDGDERRSWWHLDFLWGLDGVEKHVLDEGVAFAGARSRREGVRVDGKIGYSDHPMLKHFEFLRSHTRGVDGAHSRTRRAMSVQAAATASVQRIFLP